MQELSRGRRYRELVSVQDVLMWLRAQHGVSYSVIRRIDGGFQGGAFLVTCVEWGEAVLKWSPNVQWAAQVLRAAPVIEQIRADGYPTPKWLQVGVTDKGYPFQVQELVAGRPLGSLDDGAVDLLLEVVDRQASLNPDPGRSWNDYAKGVVFGGGAARIASSGDAGATVVDAFGRLCLTLEDLVLPGGDMVHGDMSVDNVLALDGAVTGVVDIEALGNGSRVFDLASVVRTAYLNEAETAPTERVREAAEGIAGEDAYRLLLTATVYDILNFGLDHWVTGLDDAAHRMLQLASDL